MVGPPHPNTMITHYRRRHLDLLAEADRAHRAELAWRGATRRRPWLDLPAAVAAVVGAARSVLPRSAATANPALVRCERRSLCDA